MYRPKDLCETNNRLVTLHIYVGSPAVCSKCYQLLLKSNLNSRQLNSSDIYDFRLDTTSATDALKYSNNGQKHSKGTTTSETMGKSEKAAKEIGNQYTNQGECIRILFGLYRPETTVGNF